MDAVYPSSGFSASVEIAVEVNGQKLAGRQVSMDRVILAKPASIPAGEATIVVTVDGFRHARRVHINSGNPEPSRYVDFTPACSDDP
jgi:hypothetical protein